MKDDEIEPHYHLNRLGGQLFLGKRTRQERYTLYVWNLEEMALDQVLVKPWTVRGLGILVSAKMLAHFFNWNRDSETAAVLGELWCVEFYERFLLGVEGKEPRFYLAEIQRWLVDAMTDQLLTRAAVVESWKVQPSDN